MSEKDNVEKTNSTIAQLNSKFGDVVEKVVNPKRTSIANVSCGNLKIKFDVNEWLVDKEKPE